MNRSLRESIALVTLIFLLGSPGKAQDPAWWTTTGVLNPSKPPDDFAAANLGQLKNMARAAAGQMNAVLSGGAGSAINAMVASWASAEAPDNFAVANLGQLKAVAKKFYDRLHDTDRMPVLPDWLSNPSPNDFAAVNIGQLKRVFSFELAATPPAGSGGGSGTLSGGQGSGSSAPTPPVPTSSSAVGFDPKTIVPYSPSWLSTAGIGYSVTPWPATWQADVMLDKKTTGGNIVAQGSRLPAPTGTYNPRTMVTSDHWLAVQFDNGESGVVGVYSRTSPASATWKSRNSVYGARIQVDQITATTESGLPLPQFNSDKKRNIKDFGKQMIIDETSTGDVTLAIASTGRMVSQGGGLIEETMIDVWFYNHLNSTWQSQTPSMPLSAGKVFPRPSHDFDGTGFGTSMALRGDTLYVGAPDVQITQSTGGEAFTSRGAVRIFQRQNALVSLGGHLVTKKVWNYDSTLALCSQSSLPATMRNNTEAGFGRSILINDKWLVIAAPSNDPASSAVFAALAPASLGAASEVTLQRIVDPDVPPTGAVRNFGRSIALMSNVIAVGAPIADNPVSTNGSVGRVYTFYPTSTTGSWRPLSAPAESPGQKLLGSKLGVSQGIFWTTTGTNASAHDQAIAALSFVRPAVDHQLPTLEVLGDSKLLPGEFSSASRVLEGRAGVVPSSVAAIHSFTGEISYEETTFDPATSHYGMLRRAALVGKIPDPRGLFTLRFASPIKSCTITIPSVTGTWIVASPMPLPNPVGLSTTPKDEYTWTVNSVISGTVKGVDKLPVGLTVLKCTVAPKSGAVYDVPLPVFKLPDFTGKKLSLADFVLPTTYEDYYTWSLILAEWRKNGYMVLQWDWRNMQGTKINPGWTGDQPPAGMRYSLQMATGSATSYGLWSSVADEMSSTVASYLYPREATPASPRNLWFKVRLMDSAGLNVIKDSAGVPVESAPFRKDWDTNGAGGTANGLPDWWETKNGVAGSGPNGNPDGDSYSNLDEYTHGTNPTVEDKPPGGPGGPNDPPLTAGCSFCVATSQNIYFSGGKNSDRPGYYGRYYRGDGTIAVDGHDPTWQKSSFEDLSRAWVELFRLNVPSGFVSGGSNDSTFLSISHHAAAGGSGHNMEWNQHVDVSDGGDVIPCDEVDAGVAICTLKMNSPTVIPQKMGCMLMVTDTYRADVGPPHQVDTAIPLTFEFVANKQYPSAFEPGKLLPQGLAITPVNLGSSIPLALAIQMRPPAPNSSRSVQLRMFPMEISSRDRAVEGFVQNADPSKPLKLTFSGSGKNYGTYEIPQSGSSSDVYIYESDDEIFSDDEAEKKNNGTLPAKAWQQEVTFVREGNGIRFHTVADKLGEFKVTLYSGDQQIGELACELTEDKEFARLIIAANDMIAGKDPPKIKAWDEDPDPFEGDDNVLAAPPADISGPALTGIIAAAPASVAAAFPDADTIRSRDGFNQFVNLVRERTTEAEWIAFGQTLTASGAAPTLATPPSPAANDDQPGGGSWWPSWWSEKPEPRVEMQMPAEISNRGLVAKSLLYWAKKLIVADVAVGEGVIFGIWDGAVSDVEGVGAVLRAPVELVNKLRDPWGAAAEIYLSFKVIKDLGWNGCKQKAIDMFNAIMQEQEDRLDIVLGDQCKDPVYFAAYMGGYLAGYVGEQVASAAITMGGIKAGWVGKVIREGSSVLQKYQQLTNPLHHFSKAFTKVRGRYARTADELRAMRAAAAKCGPDGKCLVAGTLILMADHSFKKVDDIVPGDWVWADDPMDSKPARATRVLFQTRSFTVNAIRIDWDLDGDGRPDGTITSSPTHPFYVETVGWVDADHLRRGQHLMDDKSHSSTITTTTIIPGHIITYDLGLDQVHGFFAGGTSQSFTLTHNVHLDVNPYGWDADEIPGRFNPVTNKPIKYEKHHFFFDAWLAEHYEGLYQKHRRDSSFPSIHVTPEEHQTMHNIANAYFVRYYDVANINQMKPHWKNVPPEEMEYVAKLMARSINLPEAKINEIMNKQNQWFFEKLKVVFGCVRVNIN